MKAAAVLVLATLHATAHALTPSPLSQLHAHLSQRRVPLSSPAMKSAADATEANSQRSALVLGWFFASDRELDHVRKMYVRAGFTDVVIQPTKFGVISKPRGWYRSMRKRWLHPETSISEERPLPNAELARHFDVVHCLSGGFLALYVLLSSGVGLRFSTLLFDSTPILPKPAAFTRFARAYMRQAGLGPLLQVFPETVHQWLVQMRWAFSLAYIKLRHRALRILGHPQSPELSTWVNGPVSWALSGDYTRASEAALGTINARASSCAGSELIFMYNPDDPFIDPADVGRAAALARKAGLSVREELVPFEHIKGLFSAPKTIFNLLQPPAAASVELVSG